MRPDRLARLHRAVDRQAAEAVLIVPFSDGGYLVGAPDPERPAIEIFAYVTAVPKTTKASGTSTTTGHNVELRTATHTATFTSSRVPYGLRSGDRFVMLERATQEFKLAFSEPFGTDRTIARLEPLPREDA